MTSVARLTDYFTPEHYDLNLAIDGPARTFNGTVTVSGTSTDGSSAIKLHAKDLVIESAAIDGRPAEFTLGEHDELSVSVEGLTAGEHTATVTFSGKITDQMHGLYPCYYTHDGVKKELFATQFESHHAREVFPCIDEPAAKATFALELTTAPDQTVLSNMPVKDQSTIDGQLVTSFDTTPRMSTYLLAFVTGELQKKTAKTKSGVEVNVWATVAQPAASLDYPLDISVRVIEFFDEYYGTPYPLPKCDHVALPDFSSGAMENWGLITYREIALLADPQTTGISSKQYVAAVIAHELSHQWFGNLVTMEWWNDLWLNESFATIMSSIALDHLHPEWNTWLEFAFQETIFALRRDAIDGVQAVQVDVNHPDEISTLFDPSIVYAKGARLMRMLQYYIGDDAFQAGLKQYFADHAYGNTVGQDLWDALETASGKQVSAIMNTWITQSGYPVVTVTRDGEDIELSQKQFFIGPHAPSDQQWPIPLDSDDNGAPKLLDNPKISYPSKNPIRLNRTDSAHFIVNYDEVSRKHLIDQVADGSLDPIGRIQLLHEATLLARGGVMTSEQLIPLLQAYRDETLEPVWNIIGISLAELRKFIENDDEAETKLRQLSAWIASGLYERLGWDAIDGESDDDSKLRGNAISMTIYGQVPEAIDKAKEIYANTKLEDMDPELRGIILSAVVRYGDDNVVDELLQLHNDTASSEIRLDVMSGLTSTTSPEKIRQLLECIKNPEVVKPQDVFRWFAFLVRGRESRALAWQWIQDNWDWVESTFAGDKSYDDFARYSANGLMTREQMEEYKAFFEPKKSIPALTRTIAIGISEIEGRVELIEKDEAAVVDALKSLDLN